MGEVQFSLGLRRPSNVHEDWLAWLPADKEELFGATVGDLEVAYSILSVTLNGAFTLCQSGKVLLAREQAVMFSGLFDGLAGRLRSLLRVLSELGRCLPSLPHVAPLQPDFFRSEHGQRIARSNFVLSLMVFRTRTRFFRKLNALDEATDHLQAATHHAVAGIAACPPERLRAEWTDLEILDYDLNTCLRETMIVLKSFLRVLPSEYLSVFRSRLLLSGDFSSATL